MRTSLQKMAVLKGFQGTLNEKLQEVTLQTIQAKNCLHEKRKCKNISSSFISNKFVDMVGKRQSLPAQSFRIEQQALNIKSCWQRVHNRKWILGVSLVNISESQTLTSFSMVMKGAHTSNMGDMHLLRNAAGLVERRNATSKRIRLDSDESVSPRSWETFVELPPQAAGHVIRVLDVPTFADYSEERISGVIFYSVKDVDPTAIRQANIPVFELNAKDFATGKYRPLSSGFERNADVLSAMLSSEHALVAVRPARVLASPPLLKVLTDTLKFDSPTRSLLFGRGCTTGGHPELSGMLIMVSPSEMGGGVAEHTIDVFARNDSQIYLLVHCLYAVMPRNTVIYMPKLSKSSAKEVLQSLRSEQQLVRSYLCRSDDSHHFGEANKREPSINFRKTLSEIECRTDQLLMGQF